MQKCEVEVKKEECRGCSSKLMKPGIFAIIGKISLGLQKFRNHSENFATLETFFLCENFARLAKFTVPSEISQFRYLTKILLG